MMQVLPSPAPIAMETPPKEGLRDGAELQWKAGKALAEGRMCRSKKQNSKFYILFFTWCILAFSLLFYFVEQVMNFKNGFA